jgi:hypothetical protein
MNATGLALTPRRLTAHKHLKYLGPVDIQPSSLLLWGLDEDTRLAASTLKPVGNVNETWRELECALKAHLGYLGKHADDQCSNSRTWLSNSKRGGSI